MAGLAEYLDKKYGSKKKSKKPTVKKNEPLSENNGWEESVDESVKSQLTVAKLLNTEPKQQETIYRDKKGRKINIEDKLKEDEFIKAEKFLKRQKLNQERNVNEIELLNNTKYQDDLQTIKNLPSNVYLNDIKLNEEYQNKINEDDPLLLMSNTHYQTTNTNGQSKTGRKLYDKGVPPVNRFNIVPGYRWDGIDRSNGYELKWFHKQYESVQKETRISEID